MERGKLGLTNQVYTAFVFEGLIANCSNTKYEKLMLKARRWEAAFDTWVFDLKVCDYMSRLASSFDTPIQVITWHNQKFADLIIDYLWNHNVPVRESVSESYASASNRIATDVYINCVYDVDPSHRFGYGFKQREFSF